MLGFQVQLLDTAVDEVFVNSTLWQSCDGLFSRTVNLLCFRFVEVIVVLLTERSITLFEGIEAELADTVHMPERIRKIDPFLASVSTYRRTGYSWFSVVHVWHPCLNTL